MKKAQNLFVVIAREVQTDANDNMNSIVKIVEKFTFQYDPQDLSAKGVTLGETPVLFNTTHAIATSWHLGEKLKKDEVLTVVLQTLDPKGKELGEIKQDHVVPKGIDRLNMNFNMAGLPISSAGNYELKAKLLLAESILAEGTTPFVVELEEMAS